MFLRKRDLEDGPVNSPEGLNIKRYAVREGSYGILKKRLHPYSTDVESEVAVSNLGHYLGIKMCDAWLEYESDDTLAFSKFEYNFASEYIVHVGRTFERRDDVSLYQQLIERWPRFRREIQQMIILDFITRQDDRHLSNMALKISEGEVTFYPLYDNGRSLFHEGTDEFMKKAVDNVELYSTEFGGIGTYYDAVKDILEEVRVDHLVDLGITKNKIKAIYQDAGLRKARLKYATEWTFKCIKLLKSMN